VLPTFTDFFYIHFWFIGGKNVLVSTVAILQLLSALSDFVISIPGSLLKVT
jgi:hypothetical protein